MNVEQKAALRASRQEVAEEECVNYDFGYPVLDGSGWEFTEPGEEWVKPLFFQPDEPGDSLKGHFVVRFEPGTANVVETYGVVAGEVVGNRTSPLPPR